MAVLIDPPTWPAHGRLWSHLASDTSYDELHAFCRVAGVPMRAFEGDHYDVPAERYDALVAAGAVPVASRDLLRALQASGLRIPKRKGERVVESVVVGDVRHDLVVSGLPTPAGRTVRARAVALAAGAVALVEVAGDWTLPGDEVEEGEEAAETAARALAVQTGLVVAPGVLAPCGHDRQTSLTVPADRRGEPVRGHRATYDALLAVTLDVQVTLAGAARWLPAGDALPAGLARVVTAHGRDRP